MKYERMETITYKDKEYVLRFGWGAQYFFEAMQGTDEQGRTKPFNPTRTWDLHRMLYASLAAYNRETWDESLDDFLAELEAMCPQDVKRWMERLVGEIAAWSESLQTGQPADKKKAAPAP